MKIIIDTSSLLSLVRYYLPFDQENKLFDFVKEQIRLGTIVIIDAVLKECEFVAKKTIVKELNYLIDTDFKKLNGIPAKTKDMLPPSQRKFYNLLNDNFKTQSAKILSDPEFEQMKSDFLESADARILIYALNERLSDDVDEVIIVTEESETANDHKAFKKIPALAKILNLKVITLPELLRMFEEVIIEFK